MGSFGPRILQSEVPTFSQPLPKLTFACLSRRLQTPVIAMAIVVDHAFFAALVQSAGQHAPGPRAFDLTKHLDIGWLQSYLILFFFVFAISTCRERLCLALVFKEIEDPEHDMSIAKQLHASPASWICLF